MSSATVAWSAKAVTSGATVSPNAVAPAFRAATTTTFSACVPPSGMPRHGPQSMPDGVSYDSALRYSRLMWVQFYPRQTMAVLIRGLEEAFARIGGVPAELLFDQLKAVIIDDHRQVGGKLLENLEFLRFAAHWGFRIRACRP